MKIHRAWIRATAAAATIATFGGQFAAGQSQYGPYATTPQTSTVARYGVQPTQPPVYPSTGFPSTDYRTAALPESSPSSQQPAYTPARPPYQPPQYKSPQYQSAATRPSTLLMARKPKSSVTPNAPTAAGGTEQSEDLPAPNSASAMSGASATPSYQASPYPSTDATNGYFASDPGYAGYGIGGYGYPGCGIDGCQDDCNDGSQWFGGVYGLYMPRSRPSYRRYTVGVDTGVTGTPYYPASTDTENESSCGYLDPDWREGVEVRFGSTFGIGDSCDYGTACDFGGYGNACGGDSCGCQPCCTPCCQQMFAWEVAWWGMNREVQEQYVDGPLTATFRYYGMVNYAGLEYDEDGAGVGAAAPVNDFYNYQIPITGVGTERVVAQRVRTNFWSQNLELNIFRLPLYTGGCGCDCASPFSLTGLCGVRYFRFGDDLEFATEWRDTGSFDGWGNGTNELFHQVQMENQLLGFQLGVDMNYCVASRWNVFWDTNFGLYNNHINEYQRMYNPINGPAQFTQDGRNATVLASTNAVAFLGEMRLGGGYLFTQHLRGILAYRAIAISGVGLAPDQIKPEYSNWADTALIDTDGSIIIHGIQAGFECNY